MRGTLITLALVLAGTIASAADYVQYVAPDGRPTPPGKYWRITTHSDGSAPTVALVLDTGSSTPLPPGPGPGPAPVVDVAAKIDTLISGVLDPTKAATAAGVSEGYKQVLLLVSSGMLTTPDNVRMAAKFALEAGLSKAGKLPAWKSFVNGMDELTEPMDLQQIVTTYQTAQAKLGGAPPPDPPLPPPGTVTVTLVYEKDQAAIRPAIAAELQRLNADGDSSVVATEFERDTVNGLGQTPTQYVTALAEARKVGLPAIVVQRPDGTVTAIHDPKTAAEITEALK